MAKYLYVYHGGKKSDTDAEMKAGAEAWGAWLVSLGDAAPTYPTCIKSPNHEALRQLDTSASVAHSDDLTYRRIGVQSKPSP